MTKNKEARGCGVKVPPKQGNSSKLLHFIDSLRQTSTVAALLRKCSQRRVTGRR
jgi:hypothetical protein